MGFERDGWGDPQRDRYGRQDQERYNSARDYGYASSRDHQSDRDRQEQGYGSQRYAGDRQGFGDQNRDDWRSQSYAGAGDYYRDNDRGEQRRGAGGQERGRDSSRQQQQGSSRRPSHDDDDRSLLNRAGDEVRSWFGDEEAERRREADARRDGQGSSYGRDEHYHSWRTQQLQAFDRDYSEYRQENQAKFHEEFASFRSERQSQRELLNGVQEHAEVVGSDGEHVGTVDKVSDDRIVLTKNDKDAGGRHHSIPSRWLQSAEGNKVMLRKTASEAQAHWRDEERQGEHKSREEHDEPKRSNQDGSSVSGTNLNRSFSGTY